MGFHVKTQAKFFRLNCHPDWRRGGAREAVDQHLQLPGLLVVHVIREVDGDLLQVVLDFRKVVGQLLPSCLQQVDPVQGCAKEMAQSSENFP